MTRMLIARHGQSVWNAEGRWQGRADPPLSDLGRRQALSAAARVGSVDAVVASPLQRALETATTIAAALGVGPVLVEADLQERDAGEWSGLTRPEIEVRFPGYLAEGRNPPGFEPDDLLLARSLAALERIGRRFEGGEVLVISHGGVIYALERHHGEPFARIPNLGARRVTRLEGRTVLGERLQLVDDDELSVPAQI